MPQERGCAPTALPLSGVNAVAITPPAAPTRKGVSRAANDADLTSAPVLVADGGGTPERASLRPRPLDSTERRRGRSRYIPAAVRRAVWDRDGARCAYVSRSGVRCGATAALEYHHRVPFAEGGASTVDNLALACVRHNALEAKRWFNSDRAEFEGGASGVP